MFIKKIKIKNFKTLKDFEIEPKPLTLLFGANSSGKSNFIRAMLFFKKNVLPLNKNDKSKRPESRYVRDKVPQLQYNVADTIDLISFEQTVSDNDISKKISFEFILDFNYWFPKNIFKPVETGSFDDNLIPDTDRYENRDKLKANISVYFEFSNSSGKGYLSKITFKDLKSRKKLNFLIDENSLYVKVTPKNNIAENYTSDKPHISIPYSMLPFYKIDNDNYIKKLNNVQYKITKDFGLKDGATLNPNMAKELYKTKDVQDLMSYYLYFNLLPLMFNNYFLSFHLPQLRMPPAKIYLLEDNIFSNKDYYNLLNNLYKHQESVVKFLNLLNNDESKNVSTFKHFADLIKITNKIRNILSDNDIWALYSSRNSEENNTAKYKIEKALNKNERLILTKLIKHNDFIDRLTSYDEIENNLVPPSIIANISFNINDMISKLGFKGSIFISKEDDIGRIYIIKDNYTLNLMLNESSGFLQLLPVLLGHCLLIESYDYNLYREDAISYQVGFMVYAEDLSISVDSFNSLYIEQPELHLHPKLQADYISILLKDISKFNNFNNVIMETHSEHILKKVQIEIAKGNIDKNTVSVFYFDNDDGTTAKEMRINNDGFFDEQWPKGFFDESYKLTKQLLFAKEKNGTTNSSN